jgi:solute carrier family 8 (sodium/calcium exchanger)
MCAFIPPVNYSNGWLTFYGALVVIAIQTAFVSDVGESIGCCLGIPDKITAFTLVALGTSLPDTFASRTAALQDDNADSSVTNVTGSNSVNVFLGSGLTWTAGAIYWWYIFRYHPDGSAAKKWHETADNRGSQGVAVKENYEGKLIHWGGALGQSVVTYAMLATVALTILGLRRKFIGGEFGGNLVVRNLSSLAFFSLWLIYCLISSYVALTEDGNEPNLPYGIRIRVPDPLRIYNSFS